MPLPLALILAQKSSGFALINNIREIGNLAEIGVVVLLFEIGLETDLKALFRVGRGAAAIARRWPAATPN